MRALTNLRKYPRYPLVAPLQVSWKDARGIDWNHEGYCLETSVGGLKMMLSHAVPTDTSVTLRMPEPQFNGSAVVCHCTLVGPRYLIGWRSKVQRARLFKLSSRLKIADDSNVNRT